MRACCGVGSNGEGRSAQVGPRGSPPQCWCWRCDDAPGARFGGTCCLYHHGFPVVHVQFSLRRRVALPPPLTRMTTITTMTKPAGLLNVPEQRWAFRRSPGGLPDRTSAGRVYRMSTSGWPPGCPTLPVLII